MNSEHHADSLLLFENVAEEVVIAEEKRKAKRLGGSYCVVKSCKHNQQRNKGLKFFKFPKGNPTQSALWAQALNRVQPDGSPWSPRPSSRICSAHFVSGKWSRNKKDLDYVPSLFLPRSTLKQGTRASAIQTVDIIYEDAPSGQFLFSCTLHPSLHSAETQISSANNRRKTASTETEHNPLVSRGSNTEGNILGINRLESFSDAKMKAFTGIGSNHFTTLLYNLSDSLKDSRLCKKNRIFLFLVRLRLGLPFNLISGFFGVTQKVAKASFLEVMEAFHTFALSALTWCSVEEIRERMPGDMMASLPGARVILLFFQVTSLKFIFGLAPHGEITFVSEGFPESLDDMEALQRSGLLDILQPGDFVLTVDAALRGNEEIFKGRQLGLVVLPHKSNRAKASSLLHPISVYSNVERTVKKLKTFKFTSIVSNHMLVHLNKLMLITGFLCNDTPSIIVNE